MTRPATLTIAEAGAAMRRSDLTARALTEDCLAAIESARPLNAFVHETPEKALAMADEADRRRAAGDDTPLLGVPLGIKDVFCTAGVASQAASRILDGFVPPYESTVTSQLWSSGAVMLGKLNMDEFAMGSSTEHTVYGACVSPWRRAGDIAVDTARGTGGETAAIVPGGSSGGSAAAVAADLCLGATATDTGGSIRQPAAFCGVVGIKPTYGRCSRWGIMAFASSLDQAGPIAKTVEDAAILLGAMAGHDPADSTSATNEVPDFTADLAGDLRGRRIGVPKEYREGLSDEMAATLYRGAEMLRDAGAEVVEVSMPNTRSALPAYYVIAPAEASSNLARYDGVRYGRRAKLDQGDGVLELYEKTRAEGFGPEVRRRVMIGAYVLSAGYYDAYYIRAQKVRALVRRDFDQALEKVDALLAPATPSTAFAQGEFEGDPVQMYQQDVFSVTLNLAGLPGISVPMGLAANGLPLGLQLIGAAWGEQQLFGVASALEARAGPRPRPNAWW
ncbi:MAG: Asp-tRNA(Asn)/Glu-tRNA(Gln) amidotransferase subunit GatA [Pseudomonadota bacterium]